MAITGTTVCLLADMKLILLRAALAFFKRNFLLSMRITSKIYCTGNMLSNVINHN